MATLIACRGPGACQINIYPKLRECLQFMANIVPFLQRSGKLQLEKCFLKKVVIFFTIGLFVLVVVFLVVFMVFIIVVVVIVVLILILIPILIPILIHILILNLVLMSRYF